MKKLLRFLCILLPVLLFSQTNYSVEFTAGALDSCYTANSIQAQFGTNDFVIFTRAKMKDVTKISNWWSNYNTAQNRNYFYWFNPGSEFYITLVSEVGNNEDVMRAATAAMDTNWHSFIIYVDNSDVTNNRIYYDGDTLKTVTNTFANGRTNSFTASPVNLGTAQLGSVVAAGGGGYISKVAVWSAATIGFTDAMAQHLHSGGQDGLDFRVNTGIYDIAGDLVSYYEIMEGSGTSIEDLAGSEDLTISTDTGPSWSATAPSFTRAKQKWFIDADEGSLTGSGKYVDDAWADIDTVNNTTFQPSDTIAFRDGTYREQLTVPSSGTDGNSIIFTVYDSTTGLTGADALALGDTAVISGADLITPGSSWSRPTAAYFESDYEEDSEGTNPGEWDSITETGGTCNAEAAAKKNGTYGMNANVSNTTFDLFVTVDYGTPQDTIFYGFWWQFTGMAATADDWGYVIRFYDGGQQNSNIVFLYDDSEVQFKFQTNVYDDVDGPITSAYTNPMDTDTWYYLHGWHSAGDGDGDFALYIAGIDTITYDTLDTDATYNEIDKVLLGFQYGGNGNITGGSWYFDDFTVHDDTLRFPATSTGNIWQATVTTDPQDVVAFDGVGGKEASNHQTIDVANEWYWYENVLNIYATSDPDAAYTSPGIESSSIQRVINHVQKSYITYSNLEIKFGYERSVLVWGDAGTPSTNVIFDNCIIHDSGHRNIDFLSDNDAGVTNSVIRNCTIYNGGLGTVAGSGIGIELGSELDTLEYNHLYNNGTAAIELLNGDSCVIRGNNIHNNGTWSDYGSGGHGIDNRTGSVGNEFYYNIIRDNTFKGFTMGDNAGTLFYNNVLYGNLEGEGDGYTNLFDNDAVVKNNIFMENKVQVNYSGATADPDYNLYYDADSISIMWNGTKRTLSAHQSASSKDASSLDSDPLFTDVASDDFTLQSGSPAIDAGTDVGLVLDYDGNIVPADVNRRLVDIGAYEFLLNLGYQKRYKRFTDYWRYRRY